MAAGFWLLRVPRAGASIHDCRIDVDGGVSWLRICWNVLTKFEDLCVLAVFLVLTSSCVSFRFMTDANTPGVEKISACTVPKAYLDSSYLGIAFDDWRPESVRGINAAFVVRFCSACKIFI